MIDINSVYKEFEVWCRSNRQFDLDVRLHTHGGSLEHGGYISDEKTRVAFAAYRAGRQVAEIKDARIKELHEALADLIDTACECDNWDSFPSKDLEKAQDALHA